VPLQRYVGSLLMGRLINTCSAKTTMAISLVVLVGSVAALPFVTYSVELTAIIRIFDGAAAAGIWVSSETILLSRASEDAKAMVTTLYAAAVSIGYMLGSLLAGGVVAVASIPAAFVVGGAVAALTALLVWFWLSPHHADPVVEEPTGTETAPQEAAPLMPIGSLIWNIKSSCFGNFAYGYFQASVVLFLPLYLIASKGITRAETINIPAFFALGMLLFVNIAGLLGDRFGHLRLMRILGLIGASTIVGFVVLDQYWMMCVAVCVAGASLASISPISLALQGVILQPAEYGRGSSVYNTFYAMGMLLGPAATGYLFKQYGGPVMLYHLAAWWGVFVIFSLIFAHDDPSARERKRLKALVRAGA
jgi:MFS family permease